MLLWTKMVRIIWSVNRYYTIGGDIIYLFNRASDAGKCFFYKSAAPRSSHRRCSVRKDVFTNFAKFTEKLLCQSLFLNKVAGLSPATLWKERLWHSCFPVNFAKFLRTPFSQNTSGRLLLAICLFIIISF